jgi:hypothetical protein
MEKKVMEKIAGAEPKMCTPQDFPHIMFASEVLNVQQIMDHITFNHTDRSASEID